MAESKIEQMVEEIEDYIDGCKFKAFSSTEIIVNKEEIDELLRELRVKAPDEIKRYQKIISNKEAILQDANVKAQEMISKAQAYTNNMINEHEIMQQAYAQAQAVVDQAAAQAQEIIDAAVNDANNIRMSAMQYTDDSLANIQNILDTAITQNQARFDNQQSLLVDCFKKVCDDRAALYPTEAEGYVNESETTAPIDNKSGKGEVKLDMLQA